MEQPRKESFFRMEIQLKQRTSGLPTGLHRVFAARQLKVGMHLKTTCSAQKIFSCDSSGYDISRGANREFANGDRTLSLQQTHTTQNHQIASTQVGATIGNTAYTIEFSIGIKKPIRIDEKIWQITA